MLTDSYSAYGWTEFVVISGSQTHIVRQRHTFTECVQSKYCTHLYEEYDIFDVQA